MYSSRTFAQSGALIVVTTLLTACGGGSSSSGTQGANTSTVSAYVTDDLAGYESVELTLDSVQLRHTGSGRNCEIIAGPLAVDAAALGRDEIIEHVDTTVCEAGPYNRLHVELDEDVTLAHTVNGQLHTDQCKFVSYYDDHSMLPNRLACTGRVQVFKGSVQGVRVVNQASRLARNPSLRRSPPCERLDSWRWSVASICSRNRSLPRTVPLFVASRIASRVFDSRWVSNNAR